MTKSSKDAEEPIAVNEAAPPARDWMEIFVVGLLMGTADGVPGVSGGTIALIAGIYERLLTAINAVTLGHFVDGIRALTPLNGGLSFDRAAAVLTEVDGWFLITLLGGIITAVILVGQAVEWAAAHVPVLLFGVFFGFIGSSGIILLRAAALRTLPEVVAAVIGICIAFVAAGQSHTVLGSGGLGVVFVAGAVAVSAMILPGLSGSLLLVILGQYRYMYTQLGAFLEGIGAILAGDSFTTLIEPGSVVATFLLGGLVGLFTIARVLRKALATNREVTYAFLIALVIGALRAPIVTLNTPEYAITWDGATIQAFAGAAIIGAIIVFTLDWYAVDIDLDRV